MTTESPEAPDRLPLFDRVADYVSAAMGRPLNILLWLVAVTAWTAVFAFGGSHIASGTWLPGWFTSEGFNFPLNLITTVAELFIGFLVAAASNRSERNLTATLDRMGGQEQQIADVEDRLAEAIDQNTLLLEQNTTLTREIHALTADVRALVSGSVTAPVTSSAVNDSLLVEVKDR
jgi:low affinity Fe/Cu permease